MPSGIQDFRPEVVFRKQPFFTCHVIPPIVISIPIESVRHGGGRLGCDEVLGLGDYFECIWTAGAAGADVIKQTRKYIDDALGPEAYDSPMT
jgi:hypothetical protein